MNNSQTPYACSICRKEFRNAISLVKHVDLRHSKYSRSPTLVKKDIETTKSYLSQEHPPSSEYNITQCRNDEPFIIKIEENETDNEEGYNPKYQNKLSKTNNQNKTNWVPASASLKSNQQSQSHLNIKEKKEQRGEC